ncbi:serine/threonine protein kinase [Rhodopirellula sp. MGV]|uniref:serine/threonine protein kinase n=1 Tax=Rhodopirellula sp. MGV TaxID=2023130 RepID=UPI000B96075C|nr:serine/threonine-protein kinase [Rhodopirellula sp. MGV]OYP34903.1 hypothetical protein CGZ80_12780 [Rhodopirellula sp. MGV]PNY38200.1 serine/threonine protein kinase [Rhodopirellula baltica]
MVKLNGMCLDPDRLRRVMIGNASKEEFDSAILHLDDCQQCRDALEDLGLDNFELGSVSLCNNSLSNNSQAADSVASAEAELESLRNETACQVALGRIARQHQGRMTSQPPIENLGTYRLLELVGSGGMGAVFKAEHQRLRRQCAIKLLPPDRVAQQDWLDRFNREMTAVASLEHPGIVRATDAGHDSGWHYLVMEYLDGLDVGQVATRMGQLSVADACEIVRQAAIAISHIHDCGLVHRDIKPSNLMLTRDGCVKVLDLGLVLDGDDPLVSDERLTTVGHVMGTMPYMAPEQLTDSRDVNPRSDLYSLGATLFRLIAGRPPHRSGKGLAAQVLEITNQDAPALDTVREDVDRDVVKLVAEILSRDPKNRPADAAQIAERLRAPSQGHQLRRLIREASRKDDAGERQHSGLIPSLSLAKRGDEPPRRHWWIGAAMAGFLLVAGFVLKIQTDRGMLVLHSDLDGLTVEIKQGETVVDTLKIESGDNKVSLHKGSYRLEVEGGGKAVKLSDDVVTIGRNTVQNVAIESDGLLDDNQVAVDLSPNTPAVTEEITSSAMGSDGDFGSGYGSAYDSGGYGSSSLGGGRAAPAEALVDGKTLGQWVAKIRPTEDWESLGQAMTTAIKGVEQVSESETSLDQVIEAIVQCSRDLGGIRRQTPPVVTTERSPDEDSAYFMWYFDQVFAEPSFDRWNGHAAKELLQGNSNSRGAIVLSLHRYLEQQGDLRGGGDMMGGYGGMSGMGSGIAIRQDKFLTLRLMRGLIGLSSSNAWDGMEPAQQPTAARLARECAIYLTRQQSIGSDVESDLKKAVEAIPVNERSKLEAELVGSPQPGRTGLMGMEMGMDDFGMDVGMGMAAGMGMDSSMMAGPGSQPTYRGKTIHSWMDVLKTELDVDSLITAMEAVERLSRNQDASKRLEAGKAIAKLSRMYGGLTAGGFDPSGKFMNEFPSRFVKFFPDPGYEIALDELKNGNENSCIAVSWTLSNHFQDNSANTDDIDDERKTSLRRIRNRIVDQLEDPANSTINASQFLLIPTAATLTLLLDEPIVVDSTWSKEMIDYIESDLTHTQFGEVDLYKRIVPRPIILMGLEIAKAAPDRLTAAAKKALIIQAMSPAASPFQKFAKRATQLAIEIDTEAAAKAAENQLQNSWILRTNQLDMAIVKELIELCAAQSTSSSLLSQLQTMENSPQNFALYTELREVIAKAKKRIETRNAAGQATESSGSSGDQ